MPQTPPPDDIHLAPERYTALRGQAPQAAPRALVLGELVLDARASLVCPACAPAPVAGLMRCAERYALLAHGANPAQLPALLFDLLGDPWPLAHYFPLLAVQPDAERARFFARVGEIAGHPNLDLRFIGERRLDLRFIGERRRDLTAELPTSARWLVAGHLAEVLGERPDILAAFLARPRHFRLYATAAAFQADGGVAGGDYDAERERVQLGLGRLFEGFGGPLPGVAPFLHELGHMLDAFDAATGTMGRGGGLLPGLDARDGALYDAGARRLFAAGKAIELRRYEAIRAGTVRPREDDDLPLGHPYVFQNDGEFIAGYLELFLRTPHRFAALNPDLFDGFARLLRQDPRPGWPEDFAFYVRENRAAYLDGRPIAPAGITVPAGP